MPDHSGWLNRRFRRALARSHRPLRRDDFAQSFPARPRSTELGSRDARTTERWAFSLVALCCLLGCPARTSSGAPATLAACASVGQRCEFSPGKFGSCVAIDGCHEGNCFICQSQH
jgi:hypothetical protein